MARRGRAGSAGRLTRGAQQRTGATRRFGALVRMHKLVMPTQQDMLKPMSKFSSMVAAVEAEAEVGAGDGE